MKKTLSLFAVFAFAGLSSNPVQAEYVNKDVALF
jgi:hypothetical protein